jgi:hypothetical protein
MTERKPVQDTEWRGMAFIFVVAWILSLIILVVKVIHG